MLKDINRLVVLGVEDIKQRTLFDFHKHFIEWIGLEDSNVLTLLWTTNEEGRKKKYRKIIKDYFKDLEKYLS